MLRFKTPWWAQCRSVDSCQREERAAPRQKPPCYTGAISRLGRTCFQLRHPPHRLMRTDSLKVGVSKSLRISGSFAALFRNHPCYKPLLYHLLLCCHRLYYNTTHSGTILTSVCNVDTISNLSPLHSIHFLFRVLGGRCKIVFYAGSNGINARVVPLQVSCLALNLQQTEEL